MKDNYIIFPDIHGRTFWKEPLSLYPKEKYPDMKFIFLGDYLDPYYPYENYTKEDALNNFKEIIEAAKHDERIILLLGNHDWHYIYRTDYCRIDIERFNDIRNLFIENLNRFQFAYTCTDKNGKEYLFTHAGVTEGWLHDVTIALNGFLKRDNLEEFNKKEKIDFFVDLLDDINNDISIVVILNKMVDGEKVYKCIFMDMISEYRGGHNRFGSPIWADVHEHNTNKTFKNYYQIFGHTITYPNGQFSYEINDKWAMIDASQSFILTPDGILKPLNEKK